MNRCRHGCRCVVLALGSDHTSTHAVGVVQESGKVGGTMAQPDKVLRGEGRLGEDGAGKRSGCVKVIGGCDSRWKLAFGSWIPTTCKATVGPVGAWGVGTAQSAPLRRCKEGDADYRPNVHAVVLLEGERRQDLFRGGSVWHVSGDEFHHT